MSVSASAALGEREERHRADRGERERERRAAQQRDERGDVEQPGAGVRMAQRARPDVEAHERAPR